MKNELTRTNCTEGGMKYAMNILTKIPEDKKELFILSLLNDLSANQKNVGKDDRHDFITASDVLRVAGELHLEYTL
jgi:hypothetical protein